MRARRRDWAVAAVAALVWWPGVCAAQQAAADPGAAVSAVTPPGQLPGESDAGAAVETEAARERRRAIDELEALQGEIATLRALLAAQQALLGWNQLLVRSGRPPTGLDRGLCRRAGAWCEALPVSFGRKRKEDGG